MRTPASPKPATNTHLRVVLSVPGVHCNILEVKGAAHVDRGNDIPAMERARDEVSKGESRRKTTAKPVLADPAPGKILTGE